MILCSLLPFLCAPLQPLPAPLLLGQAVGLPPLQAEPRSALPAASQIVWVGDTKNQLQHALASIRGIPRSEAMVRLARSFLGRPYSAFSLDQYDNETLVLNLTSFDCFLLVEQLLALVNSTKPSDFVGHVKALRYRSGQINYCDRQHYFSFWAEAAERSRLITNITPTLPGAKTAVKPINFMSTHPSAYRKLSQPDNRQCIQRHEQNLVVRQAYVPIESIPPVIPSLRPGDIFALVTKIDGLDVTHVGLIETNLRGGSAIHAVPEEGVVRSRGLHRYFSSIPDVQGIAFYRLAKE